MFGRVGQLYLKSLPPVLVMSSISGFVAGVHAIHIEHDKNTTYQAGDAYIYIYIYILQSLN